MSAAVVSLPDHLAPLHGERWAVWRWVALRSAGFPAERVLRVASPELGAAADRQLDAPGPAYADAFRVAIEHATTELHAAAAEPAFREAVAWQNRRALHTGVDVLLHRPPGVEGRSKKHRQKEALVTSYLQRYCVKNDTIGFFGPVGWARLTAGGPAIGVRPGAGLLAGRSTYFEGWGIDVLAEVLARDEALLPWLAPRRMPYLHVDGTLLVVPMGSPVRLSPADAAALAACDGRRPAREIAACLLADPELGLSDEQEVFGVLRRLRSARRIAWTLEVPAEGLHPERHLRALLTRVGDAGPRDAALAALGELEAARREVAMAAGEPARVDAALDNLEDTFVRLTAAAPTRRAGETYAGRTLVYEDCRRQVEVDLGPELLAGLGPPLALVLDAARWLTAEAADLYRREFVAVHTEMGGGTLPFASFWLAAHDLIFGERSVVIEELTARLRERWARVLALPPGRRRVALEVSNLRPLVDAAFAVGRRGWPSARHHSPDVLLAASSVEAVRQGRCTFVLGEVHPAVNTLRSAFFVAQHPAPEELLQAVERDLPEPQVIAVYARARGGATLRMARSLVSPRDLRLLFAVDSCGTPPERALPTGALVVEETSGSLAVRARDGRLRFDVMDVLGELLSIRVIHAFAIAPPGDHCPRISFDRLVVCRESWRFRPADLAFATVPDEAERFLAVRRWGRATGMPRFVFVRAQAGAKPFFVDFDSPLSIDVLARAVRGAASAPEPAGPVTVTEMLPAPDQLWLTDAGGRRYASELRFVAVERGEPAA